jgi:hypothetical protein
VDAHSNQTSYFYTRETNHYRQYGGKVAQYVRGGVPSRIEYGGRNGGSATSLVNFAVVGRCTTASSKSRIAR